MKKVVINFFLATGLLLTLNLISASFEIGNLSHSIESVYGPDSELKGWINISLSNEASNSIFEDSLGNSISLINLLKETSDFEYTCSTISCISDYSATNGEETKTFNLNAKQSKIIGLKFSGEITAVNSIDFIIESTASSSCYNQIELDFLNDGIIDVGNNKVSANDCSFLKSYGCFNDAEETYEVSISTIPFCQRISLSESPGFKIGAWVKEEIAGDKKLTMSLYSITGGLRKSCELLKQGISSGAEIFCDIDYLVTKSEDYYVCIYSNSGSGTYKTKGYSSQVSNCGFNGFPARTEINTYKIFAEGKGFASVGTLNISNSLSDINTLSEKVSDYILKTYGSFDCTDNCTIPIIIISGKNQEITIKDLKAVHDKQGLPGISETKFYDLTEIPATINADFQKLHLDNKGFLLPSDYGEVNFQLDLNGKEIYSESLYIKDVPIIKSITPTTTASAFPTLFKVIIESPNNITMYKWNFGDGDYKITQKNEVTHIYDLTGEYELEINATDSKQNSFSKKFNIIVEIPKKVINITIKEKLENLNNLKTHIKEFDLFSQECLNSILDVDLLDEQLKKIQEDYEDAFYEEDYNQVMTDLLLLDIPESVITTKSVDSVSLYPQTDNMDLYVLKEIEEKDYGIEDEDKYINAILLWNQENIEAKISFKEISVKQGYSAEPVLRIFELNIDEKNTWESNPYLILSNIDDLKFKEDYLQDQQSGYTYIKLTKPQTIVFSTTEDVDFLDLPVFISPEISKLVIEKEPGGEPDNFSKVVLFILILFLLGIIGFITYIILQVWYKNKYESHLFKNRNDLYNLIIYIQGERNKGIEDKKISSKLKKSGWKSEQVNYALKKHSGKRTGMIEIPLLKIFGKFKKKEDKNITQGKFPRNFLAFHL
ncbi:MAG: PKD domain-containing protein [archaeon]